MFLPPFIPHKVLVLRFVILGSGSGGNALLVESESTRVLVDCGFTATEVARRIATVGAGEPEDIDGLILTHCHGDHSGGAPVFSARHEIPIHFTPGTQRWFANRKRFDAQVFEAGSIFDIGDLRIQTIPLTHDAPETVALRFFHGDASFAICTDLGEVTSAVRRALHGTDVLMLEANHDVEMLTQGPYPARLKKRILGKYGHISNEQSRDLLQEILPTGTTQVVLSHISETNNSPEKALAAMRPLREQFAHVAWSIAPQHAPGQYQVVEPSPYRTAPPAPAPFSRERQLELL
jgi:phosphoribosyl 1,2-cyclic phosphodiesterase